jgi:hypothetical protein
MIFWIGLLFVVGDELHVASVLILCDSDVIRMKM